jgi:FKBP-type peptidyl-prolyl cis-trans isomerase
MRSALILTLVATGSVAATVVDAHTSQPPRASSPARDITWRHSNTGLSYAVLREGAGAVARRGQSVSIHEVTTLSNGTVLFSSREKNTPITFLLGGNQVIAGVDEGVTGMRVGERRLLIVPPALSKRSSYPANTPPDSTLRIDLELMAIGK